MSRSNLIELPEQLPAPLPIPVRPRPPESVNTYIQRLAHANHLRPSQLRAYLAPTSNYTGSVRAQRLAAASGRTVEALLHTFPSLQATPRQRRPRDRDTHRDAAREAFYNSIREAARTTCNIRRLTKIFGVHSNTIIKALARVEKPKSRALNNPILDPYRDHIDELLATQPRITITHIWEIITDEHGADVSYATVRDYVARQRNLGYQAPNL